MTASSSRSVVPQTPTLKGAHRKRLVFLIALYGTLGSAISLVTPTMLDPLLNHPAWGHRTYSMSYLVIPLLILVFALLLWSNRTEKNVFKLTGRNTTALSRGILSFLSLSVPMLIALPLYLPELPHMWVFQYSVEFGMIVGLSSFAWNYSPDFSFVSDEAIKSSARIERLTTAYNSYYAVLALIVALSVGVVTMPAASGVYTTPFDKFLLTQAQWLALYFALFGEFFGIVYPIFKLMYQTQEQFNKIIPKKMSETPSNQSM